jgi:Fe-Mn family superoxide dismutase
MAQAPQQAQGPFKVKDLPFDKDAFAKKGISQETIEYHYEKHHKGYARKLNEQAEKNEDIAKSSLIDLIKNAEGPTFNLAAQIWNHDFYWLCLSPNAGGKPLKNVAAAIDKDFGSFAEFEKQFKARANSHFGSGWVWLSVDGKSNKLAIVDGHDALNPIKSGSKPILTIDVWEHAYYIDYRNDRATYVNVFWNLINWDFVEKRYAEQKYDAKLKRNVKKKK